MHSIRALIGSVLLVPLGEGIGIQYAARWPLVVPSSACRGHVGCLSVLLIFNWYTRRELPVVR